MCYGGWSETSELILLYTAFTFFCVRLVVDKLFSCRRRIAPCVCGRQSYGPSDHRWFCYIKLFICSVSVEGYCRGVAGNGVTGWGSTSRIIIEEVIVENAKNVIV